MGGLIRCLRLCGLVLVVGTLVTMIGTRTAVISVPSDDTPDVTKKLHKAPAINLVSSPACRLNLGDRTIDRIYFLHMRKSGGTGIKNYLKAIARKYKLPLQIDEGRVMPNRFPETNGTTLYVTNLRDPVSRAISHYKYDRRWDCRQMTQNKSFIPTEENTKSSLEDFTWNAERVNGGAYPFWHCAVNCQARWATGHSKSNYSEALLQNALDVLREYNLIIVLEWLKYPSYRNSIEQMFNVSGLGMNNNMYCGRESKEANANFPLQINNKTLADLRKLNQVDTDLYNYLTACPAGFDFPVDAVRRRFSTPA
jgi:hypothetical protein